MTCRSALCWKERVASGREKKKFNPSSSESVAARMATCCLDPRSRHYNNHVLNWLSNDRLATAALCSIVPPITSAFHNNNTPQYSVVNCVCNVAIRIKLIFKAFRNLWVIPSHRMDVGHGSEVAQNKPWAVGAHIRPHTRA